MAIPAKDFLDRVMLRFKLATGSEIYLPSLKGIHPGPFRDGEKAYVLKDFLLVHYKEMKDLQYAIKKGMVEMSYQGMHITDIPDIYSDQDAVDVIEKNKIGDTGLSGPFAINQEGLDKDYPEYSEDKYKNQKEKWMQDLKAYPWNISNIQEIGPTSIIHKSENKKIKPKKKKDDLDKHFDYLDLD